MGIETGTESLFEQKKSSSPSYQMLESHEIKANIDGDLNQSYSYQELKSGECKEDSTEVTPHQDGPESLKSKVVPAEPLTCRSLWKQLEGKLLIFCAGFLSVNVYSLGKHTPHIPVGQFSSTLFFFSAVFMVPSLFFTRRSVEFHGVARFVIVRALTGALAVLLKFWAASKMNYGDSVAIGSLVPIFAAISSRILWKEKLSVFTILALFIGLSGILLVAKPTFLFGVSEGQERKEYSPFFPLVPLTGGILMGVAMSLMRRVGSQISPILVSIFVSCFVLPVGIVFQLVSRSEFVLPNCNQDRLILCFGGLGMFLCLVCLNRGLTLEKSGPGTLVRNLDIPIAYGIQVIVFGRVPDVMSILGGLLVVSSVVLVTVNKLFIEKCFKFEI